MQTTVKVEGLKDEVINLGFLQDQQLTAYSAGILFLAGVILLGFGYSNNSSNEKVSMSQKEIDMVNPKQTNPINLCTWCYTVIPPNNNKCPKCGRGSY